MRWRDKDAFEEERKPGGADVSPTPLLFIVPSRLIEDDPDVREVMIAVVQNEGHTSTTRIL
jgi:hypothetical protein